MDDPSSDSDNDGEGVILNSFLQSRKLPHFPPTKHSPGKILSNTHRHQERCQLSKASVSSFESDIASLSDALNITCLSGPSSIEINQILNGNILLEDRSWMAHVHEREKKNPFPGIDLNVGWNRERAENHLHYAGLCGTVMERRDLMEAFQSFSFVRQLKGVEDGVVAKGKYTRRAGYSTLPDAPEDKELRYLEEFDSDGGDEDSDHEFATKDKAYHEIFSTYSREPMDPTPSGTRLTSCHQEIAPKGGLITWEGIIQDSEWEAYKPGTLELRTMFNRVFEGSKSTEWAREPGSWWAQRKSLFGRDRGRSLFIPSKCDGDGVGPLDDVRTELEKKYVPRKTTGHKRKAKEAKLCRRHKEERDCQVRQRCRKRAEEFMNDEWRARRREQEKRARRWTDGTLRQNRLWDAFSWVLDVDDPRENVWVPKHMGCKVPGLHLQGDNVGATKTFGRFTFRRPV